MLANFHTWLTHNEALAYLNLTENQQLLLHTTNLQLMFTEKVDIFTRHYYQLD